ncbi:MAG: ribokinase [Firmicutes bacterium]|nr:ribokinase [Bacillota bacterium]
MNKIFVFGSINMDLVFSVNRIPQKGETISSHGFFMSPGGKGANQAVAIAKQGTPIILIGSIGSDPLSLECKEQLIKYGVDIRHVTELKDINCGVAGIFIENGDNRIIIDAGANEIHDMDKVNKLLVSSGYSGDYLISQLEIPIEAIEVAFFTAKQQKMLTILNASPAKSIPLKLYQMTDILAVNEIEIEALTGITAINQAHIHQAAQVLFQRGVKAVLLTLGEKGSVFMDNQKTVWQNSYPVEAIDTTAAGDTYIGVFASTLSEGYSIEEAMNKASLAASLAIGKLGAQTSIPTRDMILEFELKMKEEKNEKA